MYISSFIKIGSGIQTFMEGGAQIGRSHKPNFTFHNEESGLKIGHEKGNRKYSRRGERRKEGRTGDGVGRTGRLGKQEEIS
jgi:hypothetical protein